MDDVKLMNNLTDEPLDACEDAWEHLSSCFLNAASILMRQNLYKDAVYSCSKALEFKSTAKGHFRRAQVKFSSWLEAWRVPRYAAPRGTG